MGLGKTGIGQIISSLKAQNVTLLGKIYCYIFYVLWHQEKKKATLTKTTHGN